MSRLIEWLKSDFTIPFWIFLIMCGGFGFLVGVIIGDAIV